MPKIKTRKSAVVRFKKTGTGKFMRRKPGGLHLKTKKSSTRKRNLRREVPVHKHNIKMVKRLLPNT
ncbi:MAG: 50S ribosomal protein L35 [Candidatus Coatesbacteria bacterium 4484_99]|uniref:Large ribosomal subunit protein bL35 n=1 Tax=Candidatus Coatesbacteria bacterium 4484_99 TaxID=1970774 RepID=A0A1W9S116_9BACT|nr:MAG: 50S ribosomal protein L35 [Candidatus Coatesbacteria bacterium 4484_99]RLC39830.1 MAG: 50S ribosomal protein L35 [Candidatus Coatesbacteria bacterium]RLC41458.1 MAG: 50S ribosomal protein L35 [Candidatus Coatesbacteria bacterium]RLC42219.1 MAG: 50S ribosomal protein L35 [Candidatus Coatesbacteria bacterium]